MKYYHVDMFVKYLSFDCMVYDDITKQEVKKWVNDTYCRCGLFARVQEIERSDVDPIWIIHLCKEDGQIKCI